VSEADYVYEPRSPGHVEHVKSQYVDFKTLLTVPVRTIDLWKLLRESAAGGHYAAGMDGGTILPAGRRSGASPALLVHIYGR
jgi:hypothetical protein